MTYDGLTILGFSTISHFPDRILMEHIEPICSLEFELTLISICSIRIRSRKSDIFENIMLKKSSHVGVLAIGPSRLGSGDWDRQPRAGHCYPTHRGHCFSL